MRGVFRGFLNAALALVTALVLVAPAPLRAGSLTLAGVGKAANAGAPTLWTLNNAAIAPTNWWDPTYAGALTTSSGEVTAFTPRTGSANLTRPGGVNGPATTTVNGLTVIENTDTKQLYTASMSLPQPFTLVVFAIPKSNALFAPTTTGSANVIISTNRSDLGNLPTFFGGNNWSIASTLALNTGHVLVIRANGVTTTWDIDGVRYTASGGSNPGTGGFSDFYFGSAGNGVAGTYFIGSIGSQAVFNGLLSDSDVDKATGSLMWQMGFQGNLQPTFPYYSAAPTYP